MSKPSNRREEIITVARNLFLSKDYENTTMAEIMEILGIAKGTIYHYFASKDALFVAVLEDIVEKNVQDMKAQIDVSSKSALEKFQALVHAANIAHKNQKLVDQLHKPANEALHSRLLALALLKQAPLYAEIIRQGCKEGVFKTDAPLECAECILSAFQFLTDLGIYSWKKEDINRRLQAFPVLLEQLLHAPAGSFQFLIKST